MVDHCFRHINGKLHKDTSFYVKISTRTRLLSQKWCTDACLQILWKFPARNEGPVWWRHESVLETL